MWRGRGSVRSEHRTNSHLATHDTLGVCAVLNGRQAPALCRPPSACGTGVCQVGDMQRWPSPPTAAWAVTSPCPASHGHNARLHAETTVQHTPCCCRVYLVQVQAGRSSLALKWSEQGSGGGRLPRALAQPWAQCEGAQHRFSRGAPGQGWEKATPQWQGAPGHGDGVCTPARSKPLSAPGCRRDTRVAAGRRPSPVPSAL